MYSLLKAKNEGLSESLVAFARKLIQTPSVSLQEEAVANCVEQEMKALAYDQVLRDDSGNVMGILWGREAEPTVLLACHMDTVPVRRSETWAKPPNSGQIENGCLFGLGAADCKGGLAAQVYAGALLKRSMLPLRGNLIVAATAAEENGCSIGTKALIERTLPSLNLRPNFAILGEPTNLHLFYGHDGWVEMDIHIEGANPFHVEDATNAVCRRYSAEQDNNPDSIEAGRPRFENARGMRCAVVPIGRKMRSSDTLKSVISQAKAEASAAAHGSGSVAVGVMVREEAQQLYTGKSTLVQRLVQAWSIDPFHPLMERSRQALAAAGCAVQPGKWDLGLIGMGTAGSVLTREFNIPTIGYGPGSETLAHRQDEYVEIGKMQEAVYGTSSIVHSLIGVPVFGWTSDEI